MRKLLLPLLLLGAANTQAADVYSNGFVNINDLGVHSEQAIPAAANGVGLLYLASAVTWNTGTSCDATIVAIKQTDNRLFDAALSAHINNRSVRVFSDDAIKLENTNICYLRAITVN